MPTMRPALHGVSFSEAYAEALAIAPVERVLLETLEFRHPAFKDEDGAPFAARIVNDLQPLTARLEASAPVDANALVLFDPCPVRVKHPDETESGEAPYIDLAIDGVSRILVEQLDYAIGTIEVVEVTVRVYASDDLSGPAILPVTSLVLHQVRVSETRVTAKAMLYDPANRGFPRQEYTADLYPGLSAR